MRILVIGGGAREHALVWKLHQSPQVDEILCAPGNPGIAALAETVPVDAEDVLGLRQLALYRRCDLTVVGPEIALAAGVVDAFQASGLAIFGPSKAAAQIESSKIWAKELMHRAGVPAPRWASADTPEQARTLLKDFGLPVVLKADGLAAGKGSVVCRSAEEAEQTINKFMVKEIHGEAGQRLEIEEFLHGPELSAFALIDGTHVLPLLSARDHKPLLDGNLGPNTGGMGGYARPPDASPELMEIIRRRVFEPVMATMKAEGNPYVGVLYAGLFLTQEGPKVIEFNCRWGDPEAQLLLPLLKSDLVTLMQAALKGELHNATVEWQKQTSVGIVLASGGYPDLPHKGEQIRGLATVDEGVHVFHAATRKTATGDLDPNPALLTDGGRVLTVVALGDTLAEARDRAYANAKKINFQGMQYRHDIAIEPLGPGSVLDKEVPIPMAITPTVAILMGSESDRAIMEETVKVLDTLGIPNELQVMSAHRTPDRVRRFAREAEARGVRVLIAGAGLSAALPGVLASHTILPVIGVPLPGSSLMGLDSLLSIVQMPPGIPVATVTVGSAGARNAAYLAASILAVADEEVRERYRKFRVDQSGGELE